MERHRLVAATCIWARLGPDTRSGDHSTTSDLSRPAVTLTPFITVLIPVRDAATTVGEALACLRQQRDVALQVVAVDDGSTDDSLAVLQRIAADWPDLEVVEQGRRGVPAAREAGRRMARAPWIGRMDADDLCPPERLRVLHDMAEERQLDVVGSQLDAFGDVSSAMVAYLQWQNTLLDHDSIVRERFVESPLAHATALIRAERLERVGGWNPDASWSEDIDLWYRLVEEGARFGKVPRVLYQWRQHPAQATRVDARCSSDQMRACKAHYLARGPLRDRRVALWSVGWTLERWRDALLHEGCAVRPTLVRPPSFDSPAGGWLPALRRDEVVLAAYGAARVRDRISKAWGGAPDDLWFTA